MVRAYAPRATFVVEDYGASPLATRFGVADKYPALFVDDVLVARPEDFFAWGGDGKGKYIPWSELANRRRFQNDVKRMIEIRLAGGNVAPTQTRPSSARVSLPSIAMQDLAGKRFTLAEYRGKPVVVEFWATWCPPCLETLRWMKTTDVNVIAIAVESKRADIEKLAPRARVVMATPELLDAFGGLTGVPTLFVADAEGKIVRAFYGAPPNLHDEIAKTLYALRPTKPDPAATRRPASAAAISSDSSVSGRT